MKATINIVIILTLFLAFNLTTHAGITVVINEIAWMGTQASSNDEWLELYNPSSSPIDLAGWQLVADDGSPLIKLKGFIPAFGYFLLERTNDSTISDIKADQIFTGSLENSGEVLKLINPAGNIADQVSKWYAGKNDPQIKASMERRDPNISGDDPNNWQTNNQIQFNGHDSQGNPIYGTPKTTNSMANNYNNTPSPTPALSPSPAQPSSFPKVEQASSTTINSTVTPTPQAISISIIEVKPALPDDSSSWVKLINNSQTPINIFNWQIKSQEIGLTLANESIAPFQEKVITFPPSSINRYSDMITLENTENFIVAKISFTGYSDGGLTFKRDQNGQWHWITDNKSAAQNVKPKTIPNIAVSSIPASEASVTSTSPQLAQIVQPKTENKPSQNNLRQLLIIILIAAGVAFVSGFIFIKVFKL